MESPRSFLLVLTLLAALGAARASSVISQTTAELVRASEVVVRGTVVAMSCFKETNGLIYTRTSLRVDEPLKGKFPSSVLLVHRGGQVEGEEEFSGFSPRFRAGEEYLVFAVRDGDGKLQCTQGSPSAVLLRRTAGGKEFAPASDHLLKEVQVLTQDGIIPGGDVTDQVGAAGGARASAVSGMLGDRASRFLQPDRGEPIPYLIDADHLPAGISLAQATNAVQQALNAWVAVTSLRFRFDGFQSFGLAAPNVTNADESLRIQLHDNYHFITESTVLGNGGRFSQFNPIEGAGWDLGGNVAGNEFRKTSRGYVVLAATNVAMQSLSTFTEVLCHEIGHALNLAHSSEDPGEPNTVLKQAMMYFLSHGNGRGAVLGAYDPPIIQQIYPANTPPFSYARVMDITTAPGLPPAVPGINEIELRGYDLQSSNLVCAITNLSSGSGAFSLSGNLLRFTPAGFLSGPRIDPASSSSYDGLTVRFSDGTNASPYVRVRVISLNPDQRPTVSDGIPNDWMITYFGDSNPAAGPKRGADDDYDSDGLSNRQEYLAGTNPTEPASAQRVTSFAGETLQWQAKAYELYEVLGSTNLSTWTRVGNPVLPLTATGSISGLAHPAARGRFFRVQKVP